MVGKSRSRTNPTRPPTYGVLVGVDVGSGPFFVEGRYTAGLAEAVAFDPVFEFAPDFRNQAVSFTVGYRFGGPRYYRRF